MTNTSIPPQQQSHQPGKQAPMQPAPISIYDDYKASEKLRNKVAVITGGDSGIGRAIAYHYALEGADIAIIYLNEHDDAAHTRKFIENKGKKCLLIAGDVGEEAFCRQAVSDILAAFGKIDILINNAAEQHSTTEFKEISAEQLDRTFRTNVYAYFYMVKAVLPHLQTGSCIINTTSVTAYRGSHHLLDYSATRGAIVTFTRSLSQLLVKQGIRVNAVAPGPIWTPLIPASLSAEEVAEFGKKTPMGHPGQPADVAPCYVFLASKDANYISGQVLHPNGGEIINT